jgi:ribonucleotide monophosphatase NagD (HAD superfamily)
MYTAAAYVLTHTDNPTGDIRGANRAGAPWSSNLVCTGVYQGGPHSNDTHDPAEFVYSDVQQCIDSILRLEKADR